MESSSGPQSAHVGPSGAKATEQKARRSKNAGQLTILHSVLAPEEEQSADKDGIDQGAIAGPSSPSRRRRRPSASRRRSSSISAAASLISSYSTSPQESGYHRPRHGRGAGSKRADSHSDDDEDDENFGEDTLETARDAKRAFTLGRSSPYHMALVSLLFSLAQGMPLASQFKVYSYMMCQVYQKRQKGAQLSQVMGLAIGTQPFGETSLPPAPELPSDPICDNSWVEDATSTYAAAMATVGAFLSLILLNRCSRLSDYFGRKPLLMITMALLTLSVSMFRVSVLLPTYVGVVALYITVMIMEASAGAPLKIAIQNYVMDTTNEVQQAGALSFTDGVGQIGAFPSSTLGGWLAVVSQNFFAPFYASIAVYATSTVYVLLFVPESKKNHHHTVIDDFDRFGNDDETEQGARSRKDQSADNDGDDTSEGDTDGGLRTESYFSSVYEPQHDDPWWRPLLHRFNFLSPLTVFLPNKQVASGQRASFGRKWRLFVLATIVLLEESFQVFLIPIILLYNTSVFQYDVVQNGYLVSLLQGVRAIYLTFCFPWAVAKIRSWFQKRKEGKDSSISEERRPLNGSHNEDDTHTGQEQRADTDRESRGRLDVVIMLLSYLLCAASFALLASTRAWSDMYKAKKTTLPPWIGVAVAIVGLQLGAGATSLRTALLVNAVSEQADEREEFQHRLQMQQQQRRGYGAASSSAVSDQQRLHRSVPASSAADDGASFHAHHERHQSKALAANQILCTVVYALIPLATSRIFGVGLSIEHAELVWIFKGAIAMVSAAATVVLLFCYSEHTGIRN